MDFYDVVKARRSIRKFTDQAVPDELVKQLVGAALQAPSSMNGQPWCFIVVRDGEIKKQLAETKNRHCPPEKREYSADFLMEAPVIVVTCVERAKAHDRGMESAILATDHLLMAAANHGLTTVYLSAYKSGSPEVAADISKILKLPAEFDPITIVPIGFPGEEPIPKTVKSADEVIFNDFYSER